MVMAATLLGSGQVPSNGPGATKQVASTKLPNQRRRQNSQTGAATEGNPNIGSPIEGSLLRATSLRRGQSNLVKATRGDVAEETNVLDKWKRCTGARA
jgi:hypothetical protein